MEIKLTVDNLSKHFGGVAAVNNCSFSIQAHSITGLIGPNGAGKTTTFNMIAGAMKPDSGRIIFNNVDITAKPAHKLFHLGVMRTFQIAQEFSAMTVLENLMAVPGDQPGENLALALLATRTVWRREKEIQQRALEVLDFLRLSDLLHELAGNLSGGQKKLLELGRAMMAEPKIILLDEPGAGVNPTLLGDLADMIERLNRERGYTFCIIEHNMDMIARLCNPVIVMAEGSVLTEGTMSTVRADPRVLDAYLGGDAVPDEN